MMRLLANVHLFNLIAFIAVLASIVILALAGKATDLAIMTGLVGVLGSFKPWGVQAPEHTKPAPKDAKEAADDVAEAATDKRDEIGAKP